MRDDESSAGGKQAPPSSRVHVGGGKDRWWHMRAWAGIKLSALFRILAENGFSISPSRVPMVLVLTAFAGGNSVLAALQRLFYGGRIRETQLVDDPIFVLGHWRAGTTLLHELLVCDPRHAYPDTYACFAPNHFLLTAAVLRKPLGLLLPRQRPMDNMEIGWDRPQEDEWALCNMGLPSPYEHMMFPNRPQQASEYIDLSTRADADRERWKAGMLWFLQCLTLRKEKRIVLKTPLHTARIRTLREVFPRARFVHIVRNPLVMFPSTIHTWKVLYWTQGAQVPRYEGLEEAVLSTFCRMYEAYRRDAQELGPDQLCEVRYEDLVSDPVGQMEIVYRQLGLGDFEPARPGVEEYAQRKADYKTNRYEISDELREQIVTRWAGYIKQYGYDRQTCEVS